MKGYPFRLRIAAALIAWLLLLAGMPLSGRAETEPSGLIEAAFELLEEGNPFTARYEQLTGRKIEPLFPLGVPYFFGGLSGSRGSGWFYLSYPNYHVHVCEKGSGYFRVGKSYLYGLDCWGFIRHVMVACKKPVPPKLSDMIYAWELRTNHVYDYHEGNEAPPFDRLKDTLQVGDMLVVRHQNAKYLHVMMYIGTLRDFGYTAEQEPSLADWLDYPLVIHCGLSPFYGERFQKLIDENPERYGMCTTTDGGVAVSIVGVNPEDAPEHGHVQKTDYDWFTMNDGGYQLTVINMTDVPYYCWYRE